MDQAHRTGRQYTADLVLAPLELSALHRAVASTRLRLSSGNRCRAHAVRHLVSQYPKRLVAGRAAP